ncbi:MAG: transcriptional repressor LexA [Caloramator sp.]|nr:transcriptional repressor LexA [Caloramator sp.]
MANNNKDKQQEILDFIKKEIATRGYPPSVREICEAVGLRSTSTVHGHLERLEKKGFIRRNPSKPRAIELVNNVTLKEVINIPIVGDVAAGQPILAIENIEDSFPLPSDFIKISNDAFILKVKGDSMIEKGIYDGDYLIVEQQSTANNGDIVVALVDDSATVKTFYKENDFIRLQPENSSMEPIIVKDCKILGKVKGLIRKY